MKFETEFGKCLVLVGKFQVWVCEWVGVCVCVCLYFKILMTVHLVFVFAFGFCKGTTPKFDHNGSNILKTVPVVLFEA